MSADPLAFARERHRSGQFAEAIAGYASFLDANPSRGDVWHLKAAAQHQAGQLADAWASLAKAMELAGEQPALQALAGMVLEDSGQLELAAQRFARAAELKPGWAAPLASRGQILLGLGRPAEALEALRAAAAVDANNPRVWNNIGLGLVSLNRIDEGERAFAHALALAPNHAMAHFNLARIFDLRGNRARAMEHARRAAEFDPRMTDAHLLLGDLFRKSRDAKGMEESFANAVRTAPGSAKARNAYAEFLSGIGRVREAREQYRAVAQDNPRDLKAALGANLLLPQVYESHDDLERWRADFTQGMDRLAASAQAFTFANAKDALLQARWTNFYLAYQGRDDRELQSRFGDFVADVLSPHVPELLPAREAPRREGRIRVGFCSHFFFNCTVGRYFASWITRLDKSRFEIFVYYTNEWIADDTRVMQAAADQFRHLPGRSSEIVARTIHEDRLDALIYPELGMHGDTFVLASLRLAPVQCAGWGHPVTTGLPAIDYFLSSGAMEPDDAANHYREKLVRLSGLGTHYGLPPVQETADREKFGLPAGETLYLVPQSLFKIHPDNDALLARVLAADPNGALVFFAAPYEPINTAFAQRIAAALGERGLEPEKRVIVMPQMAHHDYLSVNKSCDVMLDTLHWSGGNTSLDALASGLPLVTLPGRFMRGRQSAAMLRLMGIDELIAKDEDDFVEKAVRLGRDGELRKAVSARIAAGLPFLFHRDEPIRELEAFLERAVAESRRAA